MNQAKKYPSRYRALWLALILLLASAIWLKNVSKPGTEPVVCFDTCTRNQASPESEQVKTLTVLTLNMLHGFPQFNDLEQRVRLLNQTIGRLNVDFVLLQEVPWTNEHGQIVQSLAEQNGLYAAYLRANGNQKLIGFEEGVAILSRYPLHNLSFAELKPAAGFFENRVVLHATAETSLGNIDLFVTHLTHGDTAVNAAQAESLLTFVQNTAVYPTIVAGDFNAVEDSPQILRLASAWQDTFRLAHPNDPGRSCCLPDLATATAQDFHRRVDYLFTVPGTNHTIQTGQIQQIFHEPVATANGRFWVSDHAGLLATLTIEPAP